ncbi:MAG TPA: hexose kinase [Atribacteraceae bacterium]|nr:hexose kinase [Atribacteraceae bacterium]
MIHVLCLNPALDHLLIINELYLDAVNRAAWSISTPGGKGINVARAIKTVGGEPLLHLFLGGMIGRKIGRALNKEIISFRAWPVEGETRITTVLHERLQKRHTVINVPGPPVRLSVIDRFYRFLDEIMMEGDYLVLSGSLSPGMRRDLYGCLMEMSTQKKVLSILDSSGDAFKWAFHFAPFMIKPNVEEAQEALGFPIRSLPDKVRAVREFRQKGVALVVLSDGPRGLVVGWESGVFFVSWPEEVKGGEYYIGSGDSMVGALVERLSRGLSVCEAVRFAAACGLANTFSPGAGFFDMNLADRLYRGITMTPVTGCERSVPDGSNH